MISKLLTSRGPDNDKRGATIGDVSLQAKNVVSEGIMDDRKNMKFDKKGSQRTEIFLILRHNFNPGNYNVNYTLDRSGLSRYKQIVNTKQKTDPAVKILISKTG